MLRTIPTMQDATRLRHRDIIITMVCQDRCACCCSCKQRCATKSTCHHCLQVFQLELMHYAALVTCHASILSKLVTSHRYMSDYAGLSITTVQPPNIVSCGTTQRVGNLSGVHVCLLEAASRTRTIWCCLSLTQIKQTSNRRGHLVVRTTPAMLSLALSLNIFSSLCHHVSCKERVPLEMFRNRGHLSLATPCASWGENPHCSLHKRPTKYSYHIASLDSGRVPQMMFKCILCPGRFLGADRRCHPSNPIRYLDLRVMDKSSFLSVTSW